ncbi:hypothetical protein ACH5RR_031183 [Cinchona calisaya]|uniref:F-box domain-containing protein n=1 Tax=Cinchona calisaya TaxID=153742 RepID=A0ABD2YFT4_9GENT
MEEVELLWLPIEVIHHIFSYLNAKEKAQASVLSKNWLIAWRTNRRLEFEDWDFYKPNWHPQNCCIYKIDPKEFRNCMSDSLQRYQEDHIEEFKLSINLTSDDLDSLDEWLRMAVEKGVEVLDLELCADMLSSPYILPEEILAAKSLSEFKVAGCKFPKQFNNTIKIMCKNIRVLKLWNVYIDNEIFHCLVEGYPFVNDLRIEECAGLNTIKVINLFSLEQLLIHSVGSKPMYGYGYCYDSGVVNLEVDAPSLEKTELGTIVSTHRHNCHIGDNHPRFDAVEIEKLKLKMPYLLFSTWTEDRTNNLVDCLLLACHPKTLVMHRNINEGDDNFIKHLLKILTTAERIRNRDSFKSLDHDVDRLKFPGNCSNNLVDGLFLACRPKTLVLRWRMDIRGYFIEDMFKILTAERRGNNVDSCKSPHIIKPWKDDLKGVDN